jgi:nucleoside-diphosphate-sugar epimerase
MKILVTGASGFLGLNLLQHVAQAHPDATLIAADLHPPEPEVRAAPIVFQALDVRDPRACLDVLASHRPTHIVHAAAVTLTELTADAVRLTHSVNFQGTENLLQAARAAESVQTCLLLSSSGVYSQTSDAAVCDEDHPLDLRDAYARSKREAEMLMGDFSIVAARIGPAYGPFERPRATRPRVSLIRRLLDFLQSGRPVRVAGTDVCRDWTHAADIAAGLDGLLFSPTLKHRIYNVSSGRPVSAREVLEILIEQGLQVQWTSDDDADIVLDPLDSRKPLVIERLRRDTGFKPRFDFRTGLASLIKEAGA